MIEHSNERNLGLDLVRALAIILVLVSHSAYFFSKLYDISSLAVTGFFGVELFFVLSGFLIGNIIIEDLIKNNQGLKGLSRFYIRRWLRTLPAYYSVIGLTALVLSKPMNIESFVFVQNFSKTLLAFFPVSWSLAVEEWFYLLIPGLLVFLVGLKNRDKGRTFVLWCMLLVVMFSLLRIFVVVYNNPAWDFGVRKQIYLRLDSLLLGVLFASIKVYYRDIYFTLFQRERLKVFLSVIVTLVFMTAYYVFALNNKFIDSSFFLRTIAFNVISLCFILLVCLSETSKTINCQLSKLGCIVQPITYLSVTSYSIYLVHYEIFIYVIKRYSGENPTLVNSALLWMGSMGASLVTAYLIYRFVEQYFIGIRDRMTIRNNSFSHFKENNVNN